MLGGGGRDFPVIFQRSDCGTLVIQGPLGKSDESGKSTNIWRQREMVPSGRSALSGSEAGLRKQMTSWWGSFGEPRAQGEIPRLARCAGYSLVLT